MFRKCSKAHRHILIILQNIERQVFFWGGGGGCVWVCVCVCVWGGDLSRLRFVEAIYPFLLEKKIESKIPWKEFGLLLFKYCLKKGSNFQMNMSVKHVS